MKKVNGLTVYEENDVCALDKYSAQMAQDLEKKFEDKAYDDTKIKQDISGIQAEQVAQNESIKNNADNIEVLQQENEYIEQNMQHNTVSGKIITVEDSAESTSNSLVRVLGHSEQETREGYNLYNESTEEKNNYYIDETGGQVESSYVYSVNKVSVEPSTKYTLSFESVTGTPYIRVCEYDENNNFITRTLLAYNSSTKKLTWTTKSNTSYILLNKEAGTSNLYFEKVMLILGSEIKPYEPYGTSPSPNYPSRIRNVGNDINLFDKDTVVSGYYLNESGGLTVNPNYCVSDFIKVVEGHTYHLPARGTSRTKFYDENKVAITSTWDVVDDATSFIVPENAKYIRFSILTTSIGTTNAIDINTFKFQEGSVATVYSPYGKSNLEFVRHGKNRLTYPYHSDFTTIIFTDNGDGSIKLSGELTYNTSRWFVYNQKFEAGTYRISSGLETLPLNSYWLIQNNDTKSYIVQTGSADKNFTISEDMNLSIGVVFRLGTYDTTLYPMVEKTSSTTTSEWEKYNEKRYTFTLEDGQELCGIKTTDSSLANYIDENGQMWIADYLADDGIHKPIPGIVLDGVNNKFIQKSGATKNTTWMTDAIYTANDNTPILCTHMKKVLAYEAYYNGNTGIYIENKRIKMAFDLESELTTLESTNAWLAEQYANGTPVTIKYVSAEEEIIPYTEEQQKQYDALQKIYMQKGMNNLYSTNNLVKDMTLTYMQDAEVLKEKQDNKILVNKLEIKQLQSENALLEQNMLHDTKVGEIITVHDSAKWNKNKLGVFGYSEQETRSGYNCYVDAENLRYHTTDVTDAAEDLEEYDGYKNVIHVKQKVAYCTVKSNLMNDYYRNNMSLEDKVTVLLLIKNVNSTSNSLHFSSHTKEGYVELIKYKDLSNGWAYYYATYTFKDTATSFSPYFHLATKGEMYLAKLQVTIGEVRDFEPYGVMPSSEFKSDIKSVGNDVNQLDLNNVQLTDSNTTHTIDTANKLTLVNAGTWSRVECLMTGLKLNTEYTISAEVTNGSGSKCGLYASSELNGTATNASFKSVLTIATNENGELSFMFYGNLNSTSATSTIIFDKIKVQEGKIVTTYSEYGKSNIEFVKHGKNWFGNIEDNTITDNSVTVSVVDDKYTVNGTLPDTAAGSRVVELINLKGANYEQYVSNYGTIKLPAGTYYLSVNNISGTVSSTTARVACLKSATNVTGRVTYAQVSLIEGNKYAKFILSQETEVYFTIFYKNGTVFSNYSFNIQLEKSESVTDYEPYNENRYIFTLEDGQELCGIKTTDSSLANYIDENGQMWIADYLADDGIHKPIPSVVLNGTESIYNYKTDTTSGFCGFSITLPYKHIHNPPTLCSHLKYNGGGVYANSSEGIWLPDVKSKMYVCVPIEILEDYSTPATQLSSFKTWLAEQYANGTPVTIKYVSAEEEIIPYTEEQQKQYDALQKISMQKGTNNLYSTNEFMKHNELTYMQSTGIVINNLSNAIVALGGVI